MNARVGDIQVPAVSPSLSLIKQCLAARLYAIFRLSLFPSVPLVVLALSDRLIVIALHINWAKCEAVVEQEGKRGEISNVRLGSFNCKFWPPRQRYVFKSLSSSTVPAFFSTPCVCVLSETDSDYACEDVEYNAIRPACWRSELEPAMLFLQRRA